MASEVGQHRTAAPRRRPAVRRLACAAGFACALLAGGPALAELDPSAIEELEGYLHRLGFEPGAVDGVADVDTAAAIARYQTFSVRPVDGVASEELLQELRGVVGTLSKIQAEAPDLAPDVALAAPADPPETTVEPAAVLVTAAPAPADEALAAPAPPGTWRIALHLASLRTPEGALEEWDRLLGLISEPLDGMSPGFARVDLPDKGIFYRLYVGPFPNKATADDLCAQIKTGGFSCLLVTKVSARAEPFDPPVVSAAGSE